MFRGIIIPRRGPRVGLHVRWASGRTAAPTGAESSLKRAADRMPTPRAIISPVIPRKVEFPAMQSQMQVGTIYRPGEGLRAQLEEFGAPSSIRKALERLDDGTQVAYLWRQSTQELLQRLTLDEEETGGAVRILLQGPMGVGKTTSLLQLADYLWQHRSWTNGAEVIVYFPTLARWTAGYYPYLQSRADPAVYDQPELALEIMKQIAKSNAHLALEGLIAQAVADPSQASNLLQSRFLASLRSASSRLVILADEINALYAPTGYFDVESKGLSVERMSVVRAMREFIEDSSQVLVAAESNAPSFSKHPVPVATLQCEPQRLGYLSTGEVKSLLEYYRKIGHVVGDVDSAYAEKIRFVSGGTVHRILPAAHYDAVYQRY